MLTDPKYLLAGYSDYVPAITDSEAVLRLYLAGTEPALKIDASHILELGVDSEWTRTHLSQAVAGIGSSLVANDRYIHNVFFGQKIDSEDAEIACTPHRPSPLVGWGSKFRSPRPRVTGEILPWSRRALSPGEVVMVDAPITLDIEKGSYCLSDFPTILARPSDLTIRLDASQDAREKLVKLLRGREEWFPLCRIIGVVRMDEQPALSLLQLQIRSPREVLLSQDDLRLEANTAAAYIDIVSRDRQDFVSTIEYSIREEQKRGASFQEAFVRLRDGRVPFYLDAWKEESWKKVELNPFGEGISFWLGMGYLLCEWERARSGIDMHVRRDLLRIYRKQFGAAWMKDSHWMEALDWAHLTRRGTCLLRKRLKQVLIGSE